MQVVFRTFPVDVPQGLGHYLVDQLSGQPQVHPALFQPADGQQVFHQVDQPHGVIIDVGIHLLLGLCVKQLSVGQEIAGIPRDRGQGCA